MEDRIRETTSELSKITAAARARFGGLSVEQLNWKPAAKSWSVAQCLDHLVVTHSLYLPLFERLAAGDVAPSLWERFSPLSGFFGRFLIRSMRPENQTKMKTTAKAAPSASDLDGGIVDRFAEHQDQLIEHLRSLPRDLDPATTIVTSPLLGLITYSLADTFTILVLHGQRHLGQARRVIESTGFPS